jgi:hypothetical protein
MIGSYFVDASDPRYRALAVNVGDGFMPTADGSALMGQWHRDGYRYVVPALARHLGALVAVVKDWAAVPDLIAAVPGIIEGNKYGLEGSR